MANLLLLYIIISLVTTGSAFRGGSILLLYSTALDDEPVATFRETQNLPSPLLTEAAAVIGPSTWIIYGRYGTNGIQMADFIRITSPTKQLLNPSIAVLRVEKDGHRCEDQRFGLASERIITTSAFIYSAPVGNLITQTIRPTRYQANGGLICYYPCWALIDLGVTIRLQKLAVYGGGYLSVPRYMDQFSLEISLDNLTFSTYMEENMTKVFVRTRTHWTLPVDIMVNEPVIGRFFKFDFLSGTRPGGVRLEMYGCVLHEIKNNAAVLPTGQVAEVSTLHTDVTDKCIIIHAPDPVNILVTAPDDWKPETALIKTLLKHDGSCSVDDNYHSYMYN